VCAGDLQERIELELSLKREGLRFFLTLIFGFLFAYSHLLAFAPTNQYGEFWPSALLFFAFSFFREGYHRRRQLLITAACPVFFCIVRNGLAYH
jgi:hypothetical protein